MYMYKQTCPVLLMISPLTEAVKSTLLVCSVVKKMERLALKGGGGGGGMGGGNGRAGGWEDRGKMVNTVNMSHEEPVCMQH